MIATSFVLAAEGAEEFHAHNWLLPETHEIVWGSITFVIIAAMMWKFGLPAARKGYAARTARIKGQLDGATEARATAEQEAAAIRAALGDIASQREQILTDARREAELLEQQQVGALEVELRELREKAVSDIEASKLRAFGELQAQVGDLAVAAAERLVLANVGIRQVDLVEEFIAKVGASSNGGGQ